MTDHAIETDRLTRCFGARCVVNQVDLKVPRGGVFAFVGRNGSGKSTTIRMILGLLDPTRGSARILGCDSREITPEIRARVGYMAEGNRLYGWMRIRECERFQSGFFPGWKAETFKAVIEHFRLDPTQKIRELSRGQRGGLVLALTLAQDAELLILDDPVLGLDPVVRRSLLEAMLYFTRKEGRTILFSSHLLEEVERVADHIAIIDRGVLRAQCAVETFRWRVRRVRLVFKGGRAGRPELPAIPGLLLADPDGDGITLTIANHTEETDRILAALNPDAVQPLPLPLSDGIIQFLERNGHSGSLLSRIGGEA